MAMGLAFKVLQPEIDYDDANQELRIIFAYELDAHQFHEQLTFENVQPDLRAKISTHLLNLAAATLGTSYFKLLAPTHIQFEFGMPSACQILIEDIYENGLGEFYARNALKRFGQIEYTYTEQWPTGKDEQATPSPNNEMPKRPLVLIGGGKDSLLSAQMLETFGCDYTPFAVNPKGPIFTSIDRLEREPIYVRRQLDGEMIEMGKKEGFYNGHVPSTAINSIIAALAAQLFDHDGIVLSNERSANEGNLTHDGREVNHQHSKNLAFEKLLRNALAELAPQLTYFSLLRPLSELQIAQLFARSEKFDHAFASCNTNFKQGERTTISWCGKCPKCQFVFLIFAPFMSAQRLTSIFGANLLEAENLNDFRALMGLGDQKPWECVGEYQEAAAAAYHLRNSSEFGKTNIIDKLLPEIIAHWGAENLEKFWQEAQTPSDDHCLPSTIATRVFDHAT